MRAGAPAVAAAMVVLVACTGGDGTELGPSSTPSTSVSTAPPTTVTSSSTSTLVVADPAGSVSLRVRGLTLPDLRSGGSGLRVLVRAASPTLTVRRKGAGAAVTVCPVGGVTAPPNAGECAELGPQSTVDIRFVGGVELRATGPEATVEEVTVTYLPADRVTSLVTPARPAGACARACEATFSLVPGRAGSFVLDGRGGGGRPRLVLTSVGVARGGSNRILATVEGGGLLSIRATLEAGSEAALLHHEQTPDAVAALTAEISWP